MQISTLMQQHKILSCARGVNDLISGSRDLLKVRQSTQTIDEYARGSNHKWEKHVFIIIITIWRISKRQLPSFTTSRDDRQKLNFLYKRRK